MTLNITEHTTPAAMVAILDEIGRDPGGSWGIACIKKDYLRPTTNEAFVVAVKPILEESSAASIFFPDMKTIYIVWRGHQKKIYRHLRSMIATVLIRPGLNVQSSSIISYIDPQTQGESLKSGLRLLARAAGPGGSVGTTGNHDDPFGPEGDDEEDAGRNKGYMSVSGPLTVTASQRDRIFEMRKERLYRRHLQILVVEDQVFSQKLLCEVIRSARYRNHEAPVIDVVRGIREAWEVYLRKAPDIVFVDLGLEDGSGHTLARAIKDLDPLSRVIIVTAQSYQEEMSVAQQNNVDSFIPKPYNKKQIIDCIEKYMSEMKFQQKSGHGSIGRY